MTGADLARVAAETTRRSPIAALTTLGRDGPRSRLVHPLWSADGTSGYLLTDGQSPKTNDLTRCRRVTLTYHHADLWLLITADTTLNDDLIQVTKAVSDCTARDEGYAPSDFWTDEELARLVVVELSLCSIESARFDGPELEVKTWLKPIQNPNPS